MLFRNRIYVENFERLRLGGITKLEDTLRQYEYILEITDEPFILATNIL